MTKLLPDLCRSLLVLALAGWLPAGARAESVLFLSSDPRAAELSQALELALRGYGPVVALHRGPDGEAEEARGRSARQRGAAAEAAVAVWVEHAPPARLRASAAARPEQLFDAPLPEPLGAIEASVFGSIAASLVLQALRPASAPQGAAALRDTSQAAAPRAPRSFLRPAFASGMAYVSDGRHTADRSPSIELVTEAQEWLEEGRAGAYLYDNGYDCDVSTQQPLVASDCKVAVQHPGFVYAPVLDLSAGYLVWRQLGVALTMRYSPRAGEGALASVLFGAEASWMLRSAPGRGFYADFGAGYGVGQIQVRPGADSTRQGPFVSSGLFNLRARALIGYMFAPRFGLFAGATVHVMFPNPLWALDPKVGIEVRL